MTLKDTSQLSSKVAPGRVALVTGATAGLGYNIVKRLARDGYRVVATATSQKNCDQIHAN
ncbi:MAG: SDR family NAD(P)-dependent oxidoreductase, partial [Zwartia sp.]